MRFNFKVSNKRGLITRLGAVSICFVLCVSVACAERISVISQYGSQGQGWLFGASQGGATVECWIVVPAHVVKGEGGEKAAPFRFSDTRGNTGYTETPVTAEQIDYPGKDSNKEYDVAFAKVKSGREAGDCLSRLGLPNLSYDSVIRSLPEVSFFNLIETSFGVFTLMLDKVAVDEMGGSILALKATDPAVVAAHFQQGLSGAIGEVSWQSQQYPFAMVSRVKPDSGQVFAVRFDVIGQLFARLEKDTGVSDANQANYSIVSVKVNSATAVSDPDELLNTDQCWTAEPPPNEKYVEILVEVPLEAKAVRGVALRQSLGCGESGLRYSVDQRGNSSSNWVRVGDCVSSGAESNSIDCPMDMRAPRQLRIQIGPVANVSFSQLIVY